MLNKIKTIAIAIAAASLIFFTSCDDDDDNASKPQIYNLELGLNNTQIGVIGSDLHIQDSIGADNLIEDITVKISCDTTSWSYDSTFTEFSGKRNTIFHKHVDMPTEKTEVGNYTFSFTVKDKDGQTTTIEKDLKIQLPTDNEKPVITLTPIENETFNTGDTIVVSGTVTDNIALGGIYIGLVREDQNLEDKKVNDENTITILHNHHFSDPTSYSFTAKIIVGAEEDNNIEPKKLTSDKDYAWKSANYYIVAKSPDAYGGKVAFSSHYPIVIDLND